MKPAIRPFAVVLVCVLSGVAVAPSAVASGSGQGAAVDGLPVFGPGRFYRPAINPADFSPNVDNPWFPLPVGTTYVYAGTKDGKTAIDVTVPSANTQVVDGVTTRVVEDRLYLDGRLEERTRDYYAQDKAGNVWYFGEDTATLDPHGHVTSTDGSFHAGVDGAQPGVFMQATPEVGRRFRQEWFPGHAEDTYKALNLAASVSVPYGSFANALQTRETTALEPGVVDNKYYVRGTGEVEELAVRGPLEKLTLVDVIVSGA